MRRPLGGPLGERKGAAIDVDLQSRLALPRLGFLGELDLPMLKAFDLLALLAGQVELCVVGPDRKDGGGGSGITPATVAMASTGPS